MKIVCIGGGHGLAQVLSALKPLCNDLTAIVATTDNGGSTGRIRESQKCLALGDIRRCCLQLTGQQSFIHTIFEHRFNGGDIDGHNLGNLTLLGLTQQTNSPTEAVALFNAMLGNAETILPMSDFSTDLVAELETGETIYGECEIDALNVLPNKVYLSHDVPAAPGSVEAILNADLIVIGPGSIITSIMPSLLIPDIARAIKNTSACKVFIENTMQENSVMKLAKCKGIDWLQTMLGHKICDLSISPNAISEILSNYDKHTDKAQPLHNIADLSDVFAELLKIPLELSASATMAVN
jgi:uncharacterized cofD-like protein